ncbi:MAG: glycosyltransferase [Chryseobacterium sp.]|nr:MAG: glycosyltransferase [Chryseobacterium sp.]
MGKIFLSHPTGNRNVRAVMTALAKNNRLAAFYTTIALNASGVFASLLPDNLRKHLLRRSYPISFSLIRTQPILELARNILPKFGIESAIKHETGFASVDSVYRDLDSASAAFIKRKFKSFEISAVYGYEDGCLQTFKVATKLGLLCIYDLPIGYWRTARQLLHAEQEKWPEWASTLTSFKDSPEKLARKDQELELSDRIFVASTFTANTLKDFPGKELKQIKVIPYGFPPVVNNRIYDEEQDRPLRLLFVGGLSQRKGIADLFSAVKEIGSLVELTIVGRKTSESCSALDEALKLHRWIPTLAHEDVLRLMQEHDVLVFPSLFEGFGLVITEAMSQGTPVITTERTAGPDLITHGEDGWIIEAGSTKALKEQIEFLIKDRQTIMKAGKAAMEKAKSRPWDVYGAELTKAIFSEMNNG